MVDRIFFPCVKEAMKLLYKQKGPLFLDKMLRYFVYLNYSVSGMCNVSKMFFS